MLGRNFLPALFCCDDAACSVWHPFHDLVRREHVRRDNPRVIVLRSWQCSGSEHDRGVDSTGVDDPRDEYGPEVSPGEYEVDA
jgi:hypothetical protein